MSELTDRLKTAVELVLGEDYADSDEVNLKFNAPFSGMKEMYALQKGIEAGAEHENARLQPILTALIEAVGALEFYNDHHQFSDGTQMTAGQFRDMDDYGAVAREALSRLEKELGGGDET